MVKLENNWKHKTLTNLEKDEWLSFESDSRLINRTKQLRNIPLDNFTTEDLRLIIGQQIGLDYLIPLALETLKLDLFAEGDLFEGDLLKNVLTVRTEFWRNNKKHQDALNELIEGRRQEIAEMKFDTSNFDDSLKRK